MLNFFRKRTKFFVWVIIVAFVGLIVFVWGLGMTRKRKVKDYAIKVNNLKISLNEFDNAYSNYMNRIRKLKSNKQQKLYAGARRKVAQSLIDQKIMDGIAKKYSIIATPDEIISRVRQYKEFQTNGSFSPQKFNSYRHSRYFRQQWPFIWNSERNNLIQSKIQNIMLLGAVPSNLNLKYKYFYLYGIHNADILKINLKKYYKKIPVPPLKKLHLFYKKYSEDWRVPKKIKIDFISFYYPDYFDSATVSSEEVSKFFNKHRDEFYSISQVKARHILIKLPEKASKSEVAAANQKIEHIYTMLRNGADFAGLAKKYSEDASAFSGGELGWFSRGKMVKKFEDVAFNLKPKTFSKPFRTKFGFHIIYVQDRKKGDIPPIEQLRPRITNEIKEQKAQNAAWQNANDAISQIITDTDFDTVAHIYSQNYHLSPYFSKSVDSLPILGSNISNLVSAAFSLNKNAVTYTLLQADSSYNIIRVIDIKDSYLPAFRSIRKKVLKKYKITMSKKNFIRLIKKHRTDWIKENKTFVHLLTIYRFKLDNSDFTRAKRNYEFPAALQKYIVNTAITQVVDTPVLNDNRLYFAKIIKVDYDKYQFENDKFQFSQALAYQKGSDLFNLWLKAQNSNANIDYKIFIKNQTSDTSSLTDTTAKNE